MPDQILSVAAVQMDIAWEDPKANQLKAANLLQESPPAPGSLIILPELFSSGFSMNVAAIADDTYAPDSPLVHFLADLAGRHESAVLAGVATAGSGGKARNEALVVAPSGAILARYRKIQPFTPSGEAQAYERGSQPILFEWAGARISPFICYDLRFPEHFRRGLDLGAEVIVVIANWPVVRIQHWVTLLQARAIENMAWVVGVNRIGRDPTHSYNGRTLVVNPMGDVAADARDKEAVLLFDLDLGAVRKWRDEFPALRDRTS